MLSNGSYVSCITPSRLSMKCLIIDHCLSQNLFTFLSANGLMLSYGSLFLAEFHSYSGNTSAGPSGLRGRASRDGFTLWLISYLALVKILSTSLLIVIVEPTFWFWMQSTLILNMESTVGNAVTFRRVP
jgi:hypothetical protein